MSKGRKMGWRTDWNQPNRYPRRETVLGMMHSERYEACFQRRFIRNSLGLALVACGLVLIAWLLHFDGKVQYSPWMGWTAVLGWLCLMIGAVCLSPFKDDHVWRGGF